MSTNTHINAASPAATDGGAQPGLKRERPAVESQSGGLDDEPSRHSTTSASANGPESKKRKTAPGSRGVANLTPEQLAKKRANGQFSHNRLARRLATSHHGCCRAKLKYVQSFSTIYYSG